MNNLDGLKWVKLINVSYEFGLKWVIITSFLIYLFIFL